MMMRTHIRPAKYRNTPTKADGIEFDSKAEARRYRQLKAMKDAGEILWFSCQPSFRLLGNTRYRPDFLVCGKDGQIWAEDVKGVETEAFRLKKNDWEQLYPGFELRVIR